MKRLAFVVAACAVVAAIAGCSPRVGSPPSQGSVGATSSTPGGSVPSGTSIAPGRYPKRGGRVEIVGTLVRRNIEGGFWAITKSVPGPQAQGAETLAVIANGDKLPSLSGLEGKYVLAKGTPLDGVSIRMGGPEIAADSVKELPVR